jgi:glycine cleavage system H protein
MEFPNKLKYSKEHTWLLVEGETGTVGITEFAQSELGEIVYVDLPSIGESFKQDEIFGSVEAVKTTSDLFMPVSGEIIEINTSLRNNPSLVNLESFTNGWMIKIKLLQPSQIEILLDADAYRKLVS